MRGHDKMRALVFGATGQLGRELLGVAPSQVELLPIDRSRVDMERTSDVERLIDELRPDVIINAAAYTAVDRAELQPDVAFAVNAAAPAAMAEAATRIGASLVHVSTDYVFGGAGSEPYRITDATCPVNVYGKSKAEGEKLVLERAGRNSMIVRTSWLYSRYGRNFVLTMLGLMRKGAPLCVVSDQTGAPTWARTLARAIWTSVERGGASGIVHWTDSGATTWHGFATEIGRLAFERGLLSGRVVVQPIATSDYSGGAARPAASLLDLSATASKLGTEPIHWAESLRMMLEEMALE